MSDRLREMAREWYVNQDLMHCYNIHGGYGICATCDAETDAVAALLARVEGEERERCAKVAEYASMEFAYAGSRADELARVIAAAIRALSPGTADAGGA